MNSNHLKKLNHLIKLSLLSTLIALSVHAGQINWEQLDGGLSQEKIGKDGLPIHDQSENFLDLVRTLNLEDPSLSFSSSKGGSSVYAKIQGPNWKGAFLTNNAATNPEVEAAAYQIARLLGREELVGMGYPYTIKKAAILRLKSIAENTQSPSHLKMQNKALVLKETSAALAKSEPEMKGVFKLWGAPPFSVDELTSANKLNTKHPIAIGINATNPIPKSNVTVKFKSSSLAGNQLTLTKELSTLLIIDALTNQFDRFSGGNLEAQEGADGQAHLVFNDNGGARFEGSKFSEQNRKYITRFERTVAERVVALDRFLQHQSPTLLNFNSPEELMNALGLKTQSRALFTQYVSKMAQQIKMTSEQYPNSWSFPE